MKIIIDNICYVYNFKNFSIILNNLNKFLKGCLFFQKKKKKLFRRFFNLIIKIILKIKIQIIEKITCKAFNLFKFYKLEKKIIIKIINIK